MGALYKFGSAHAQHELYDNELHEDDEGQFSSFYRPIRVRLRFQIKY